MSGLRSEHLERWRETLGHFDAVRFPALRRLRFSSLESCILCPEACASDAIVQFWRAQIDTADARGRGGFFTGRLSPRASVKSVSVPKLTGWKFAESLPEVKAGFDDSKWVTADHTMTNITDNPLFGDGRVLYGKRLWHAKGPRY